MTTGTRLSPERVVEHSRSCGHPIHEGKKAGRMPQVSSIVDIKKQADRSLPVLANGAPGEIRTPDRLVRSQVLYPAELRARKFAVFTIWSPVRHRIVSSIMAEKEGFEPSMRLQTPYSLSRGAPSTTRPSLRTEEAAV